MLRHCTGQAALGQRRAAQALEYPQLNLMRANAVELIEARRKRLPRLTGQTKNQIGMQMRLAVVQQPTQIGLRLGVVLPAADALLHVHIKTLNANLKLQHAGREFGNRVLQPVRQMVRHDFKMDEQRRACVQGVGRQSVLRR